MKTCGKCQNPSCEMCFPNRQESSMTRVEWVEKFIGSELRPYQLSMMESLGIKKLILLHMRRSRAMSMSVEQMREKLLEWNPSWNIDRFTHEQIGIIYNKERNIIVKKILETYTEPLTPQ